MKAEVRSQKSEVRHRGRRRALTSDRRPLTSGFTIVELLVVIGIVVLLAGLLIPMVMRAYRQGDRTAIAANLNTIATALEAYRNDFGDYPRVDNTPAPNGEPGTGFAVLTKALVGSYGDGVLPTPPGGPDTADPPLFDPAKGYYIGDCVSSAGVLYVAIADSTNVTPVAGATWLKFNPRDGADGEGFRVRAMGQIKAAYIQSGKLKVRGSAILDHHGHPILYFPQSPTKVNLNITTGAPAAIGYYVESQQALGTAGPRTMYNFDDNADIAASMTTERDMSTPGYPKTRARMRMLLGDYGDAGGGLPDGLINAGETPVATGPYILWSVGADGFFGTVQDPTATGTTVSARRVAAEKCDDVIHK